MDLFQHLEKVAFRRGFNGALDVIVVHDVEADDLNARAEESEIKVDLEDEA